MYKKTLYFALIAFIIFIDVDAKKSRRTKLPNDEDSTPQPNVVTYSTFGFNDVGSYDGFVPSSPDYANYLSNFNQDSSTRLYAPAFPTALESSGFNNNYDVQTADAQTYDSDPQASMIQYPQSSLNFFNTPGLDNNDIPKQNLGSDEIYERNVGEDNAPIYGTKISSKNRNKLFEKFNNTEFNIFGGGPINGGENKLSTFHEVQSTYDSKPTSLSEPNKNYPNPYQYVPTYPSTTNDNDVMKPAPSDSQNLLKFPKVIDFTKIKQYYPQNLENKYSTATAKPFNSYDSASNVQNENIFNNNYDIKNNKMTNPISSLNDAYKDKDFEDVPEKQVPKPVAYADVDFSQNYFGHANKNALKGNKFNLEYKDKFKYKPWASTNYTNDFKSWKNPLKGYQYSTDYSNTTFEFDFSGDKKPFNDNNDEIVPASSNLVDLASFQFSDTDYSNFKNIPASKSPFGNEFNDVNHPLKHQNKYNPEDYVRSLYSTVPTTTSHWGNVFKTSEYSSSHKHLMKKPLYSDDINDDIVHIPKRPYSNKYNYGKYTDSKPTPTEWSSYNNHRPYKLKKPVRDWTKDVSGTRFKTEEDLLGLRTHDTSHPTYLPTYKPNNIALSDDYEYKKLVDKWKQSYLKAKYKDSSIQDFETYPSEPRPLHVPYPKPYAIEVPHPVIVPVPQPYPIRVPIPKPVAVPVIRELTVQVEKPVPYPVIKKVPYPIEKPVPVPVEKEVQVPVVKPYAVPIPHIRPVFHHSRPREEMEGGIDMDDEDEYLPRPESAKKIPYAKRPRSSTRNRPRRPTRSYQDRNRRRWPSRHPSTFNEQRYQQRPSLTSMDVHYSHPYKQNNADNVAFDNEHSDYFRYCKRTGNC